METTLNVPIGTIFKMQRKYWKVTTSGGNGWVGVTCQDGRNAFTVEKVEDVVEYLKQTK